jgi:Gram-negative bacterial TonB protein C-terminal
MVSVMTTQSVGSSSHADPPPFSLIEQRSLLLRLAEEFRSALRELASDPRRYLQNFFADDTRDARRRQRIYVGLAIALAAHAALLIVIAVVGWRTMFVKPAEGAPDPKVVWLPLGEPDKPVAESAAPRGEKDQGGGGGGDRNPLPATKGPTPQMSPGPQIVKPNTPSVKLPVIQIPPTIVGPDSSPPPPNLALGVPNGVIAEAPSPGPGTGEGLGGKNGTGAGTGNGPGSGKGDNGGSGNKGGRLGLPIGRDNPTGPIPYNMIRNFPDSTGVVWLHRPTPVITPEAQANKVKGEVWLRATFREDGTITDIEVIHEVPYMTESAIASLQRSTFRPATIKGRPVTLLNVPVRINVNVFER